jgi:hypothetical protein
MGRVCYGSYHMDVSARKQPTKERRRQFEKEFRAVDRQIEQAILAATQALLKDHIRKGMLHRSFEIKLSG